MGELKSAVELALERLGLNEPENLERLTDGQKERISEARNRAKAKLAELEILYTSALTRLAGHPPSEAMGQRQKLEAEFREDCGRVEREQDSKIEKIRAENRD